MCLRKWDGERKSCKGTLSSLPHFSLNQSSHASPYQLKSKSQGVGGTEWQIPGAEGKGMVQFKNVNNKPARAVTGAKGETFG